jgi:hypothetical protein
MRNFVVVAGVGRTEPLEPVVRQADSGPGSLRQAIADAPDNGTIRFGVEGDIVLTSSELLIDKPLRILGRGEAASRDRHSHLIPPSPTTWPSAWEAGWTAAR